MPDKIAVITGAGSGIGRASAHALLEIGFNVVLAGRRKEMLEETAALANAPAPRTLVVPTDVSDPKSIDALFAAVKTTYGRIDLLVQQRRHQHPQHPDRRSDLRAVDQCRRDQSDRLVPVRAARLPHDEGAGPAGRPHHQQRLGVGACAAAQLGALCLDQARADRPDPRRCRSTAASSASPAARSTSATPRPTRNADTAHGRLAGLRPGRGRGAHRRAATSPRASPTWPACRPKPTSSS